MDFQKIFENFDDLFLIDQIDFSSLPKDPVLAKFSEPQAKLKKKTGQKALLGSFGKFRPKNRVFLARAPPGN